MKDRLIDIFGWYGTGAILAAYGLLTTGLMKPENVWYILLNITGSIGLTWESYRKRDNPLVVLNAAWLVIALVGLIKILT